jgi:glycosyltransferase involved in cell wall biosynthesis
MKHILLISAYAMSPSDPYYRSNRQVYLAERLSRLNDTKVSILTPRFSHYTKSYRASLSSSSSVDYIYIPTTPYYSNLSPLRILSHALFILLSEFYLAKIFLSSRRPSAVYVSFPYFFSITFVLYRIFYPSSRIVFDYNDIWPEAFQLFLPSYLIEPLSLINSLLNILSRLLPDYVFTVSETYSSHLSAVLRTRPTTLYLGSLCEARPLQLVSNPCINILYVGSTGLSYDLHTCIEASHCITSSNSCKTHLHIVGHVSSHLQSNSSILPSDNVTFHGPLKESEAFSLSQSMSLCINPIASRSFASVTNKLCFYFMTGLPIISSYYSDEVTKILTDIGFPLYESGNANMLVKAIYATIGLVNDDIDFVAYAKYQRLFSRVSSYHPLIKSLYL